MAASSTTTEPTTTLDPDAGTFFEGFADPYIHDIAPGVTAYWLGGRLCIDGDVVLTPDQAAHLAAVLLRH